MSAVTGRLLSLPCGKKSRCGGENVWNRWLIVWIKKAGIFFDSIKSEDASAWQKGRIMMPVTQCLYSGGGNPDDRCGRSFRRWGPALQSEGEHLLLLFWFTLFIDAPRVEPFSHCFPSPDGLHVKSLFREESHLLSSFPQLVVGFLTFHVAPSSFIHVC